MQGEWDWRAAFKELNYVPAEDYGVAHGWWALSDLNGRPFGCKPNALTAELSAPTSHILH
jgi:hypothetical protein